MFVKGKVLDVQFGEIGVEMDDKTTVVDCFRQ